MRPIFPFSEKLDVRTVFEVSPREFAPWLAMVALVWLAGYPGVICVTPMAWLLALRVGKICVARSRSEESSQRLLEAAIAGGLLGFLQGVLFIAAISFIGPIQAGERIQTIVLVLIQLIGGIFAGTALSFFTVYLNELRRNKASNKT